MRVLLATATVVCLSTAGLGLVAGAAGAKPAPPVAPVANTHETITLGTFGGQQDPYATEIDFAASTFTIPQFGDSGVFTNSGSSLKLTIKKSATSDRGCKFTATYDTGTSLYAGSYTCKMDTNTFTVGK